MTIIAIDYGNKRIGLAKSDPLGILAQGLTTIQWNRDLEKPLKEIEDIVREYKVELIILGLPLNMDDTEGEKAQEVREFARALKNRVGVDIIFYDERLSTVEAHEIMHKQGRKTGHNKEKIDMIAACVILQSYLDLSDKRKGDLEKMEEERDDVIVLEDEDGNPVEMVVLEMLNHEDKTYVLLQSVDEDDEDSYIFEYEEENEDDVMLLSIEDEDLLDKLFDLFIDKMDSDYDVEDEEE